MKKALSGFVIFLSSVALVGAAAGCGYGVYNTVQSSKEVQEDVIPADAIYVNADTAKIQKAMEKSLRTIWETYSHIESWLVPQSDNTICVNWNKLTNFITNNSVILGKDAIKVIQNDPSNKTALAGKEDVFNDMVDQNGYNNIVESISFQFIPSSGQISPGESQSGFGIQNVVVKFKNWIVINNSPEKHSIIIDGVVSCESCKIGLPNN